MKNNLMFILVIVGLFCITSVSASGWANQGYDAGSFNGVNSFVGLTNDINITNTTNFTISLWGQTSYNGHNSLFGYSNLAYDYIDWRAGSDDVYIETNTNADDADVCNGLLEGSNWQNIVIIRQGLNVKCYLNGIYVDEDNFTTGDNLTIRQIGKGYSNSPFRGYLDKIQIWNTTLTQANITALYNNGRINSPCGLINDSQVLCIDFDDYSLADKSGNGNNGINTNVTFTQIQGVYNTLTEGVDYTLDKVTGVLTVINPNLAYNYLLVSWSYNELTSNAGKNIITYLSVDLTNWIPAIIALSIGLVFIMLLTRNKHSKY